MLKSPRTELLVMSLLMLLAMAGFWWMQHRDPKVKSAKPAVAIQDGKTIDFSTGRPVVKDDAKQKAALEKSLKEMDAAAASVTFAPKAPTEKKSAEPSPAPPK
jgi:hypothetical protein